jgi:hypothetical protein
MKKKLLFTILAIALIGIVYGIMMPSDATNAPHGDKYCAKLRDGRIVVSYQGNLITSDVTLENGTIIKPNGTIIKRDSVRLVLKEGECVDLKGNIIDKLRHEKDDDTGIKK